MSKYRAETVGSFLRPDYLLNARQNFAAGQIAVPLLREVEDKAIREIVALQENIGFRVVTDGEFRRENWWIDFIARLHGVEITAGSVATTFDKSYIPMRVCATGKLAIDAPIVVSDFQFLASITGQDAKVTIPSPTRMHFHGGRSAVSKEAYPDIEEFFADITNIYRGEIARLEEAGCRYIQIDDPLLTYFLSRKLRAEIEAEGDTPDRRLAKYIELLNNCIATRRETTIIGIHLCREMPAANGSSREATRVLPSDAS